HCSAALLSGIAQRHCSAALLSGIAQRHCSAALLSDREREQEHDENKNVNGANAPCSPIAKLQSCKIRGQHGHSMD
ncbi:MAG: hypothetical protein GY822_20120, partial [Deltaproteobacteria bacterium]|nr:hypothetical protein [Deltaproteobacteria bacterium]